MKNTNLKYIAFVLFALLIVSLYSPQITRAAPVNLIPNGSLAIPSAASSTLPDQWNTGGFGNNNRVFTYPVAGVNGGTAARVDITTYTDGDAKWYFNNVPVTAGQKYSFQDTYLATAPTALAIEYTDASGTASFDPNFVTVPIASSTWETVSVSFTPPAGTVSVTIFHLLNSVGSLTITNDSLVLIPPPTPFNQGFVSLTFDDGLKSQLNNAKPILDAVGMKSTFYIITHVSAGFALPSSSPILADTIFTYTDEYMDTSTSEVLAQVTLNDNSVINADVVDASGTTLGSSASFPPSPTWATSTVNFYMPVNAKSVTVIHRSTANGPIIIQNVSFGAENYMTAQDVLSLQTDGQEIGAHTQTHPDLTALTLNDATTQIVGSRNELLAGGLSPVTSFNYPYGNTNSTTEQIVQGAGFTSGRTVTPGFNGTNTDQFALLTQSVNADTTLGQVQSWIDAANANKDWLILVFHDIVPNTTGDPFASTPTMLQNIVNYLSSHNIPVETVNQGLLLMNGITTTPTPTPTTTPPTSTPPVTPTTTTKNISLNTGWNLITIPVQPISPTSSQPFNYTAESFGQLAGADVVTQWLGSQQYNSHIVGLPINDFSLENGLGFFIHMIVPKNLLITGTDLTQPTSTLLSGWNLLGWDSETSTTADALGLSINNADVLSTFSGVTQQWTSHIVNLPLNNFTVSQGDGVFIHVK